MKLHVQHETRYSYADPATLGHNQVRLTPRATSHQRVLDWHIDIEPVPIGRREWCDYFGNVTTYFMLQDAHRELSVTAIGIVETLPLDPHQPAPDITWEQARDELKALNSPESIEAVLFTYDSRMARESSEAREYAHPSFTPNRPLFDAVRELTTRIHKDFRYDGTATNTFTTVAEVLRLRRGVCQDFAHVQLACLRSLGLAGRYVSGYMMTKPPPGMPRRIGADATHAWPSVYFPQRGWLDFDPTNDCIPGDDYVTLTWGRDYSDVCPVKGVFLGGGKHVLYVSVDVQEVDADLTTLSDKSN